MTPDIEPITSLKPFSRRMAEDLLTHFPGWIAHLAIASEADGPDFLIRIPPPQASRGGALEIYCVEDDEEVTVCYAGTHGHYGSVLGTREDPVAALAPIRDILDERRAVVSYILPPNADMPHGFVASGPVAADRIPGANYEYYYTTSIRVRSWRGTHDAEFHAPYVKDRPRPEARHATR